MKTKVPHEMSVGHVGTGQQLTAAHVSEGRHGVLTFTGYLDFSRAAVASADDRPTEPPRRDEDDAERVRFSLLELD